MSLNPRNTSTLAIMGMLTAYGGEWDRGYELVQRAMTLNPHHAGWFHFVPAHYYIQKGDYQAALAAVKRVNMPEFPWTYTTTAQICAALGRWEEARDAVENLQRMFPGVLASMEQRLFTWFYDREYGDRSLALVTQAMAGPPAGGVGAG